MFLYNFVQLLLFVVGNLLQASNPRECLIYVWQKCYTSHLLFIFVLVLIVNIPGFGGYYANFKKNMISKSKFL